MHPLSVDEREDMRNNFLYYFNYYILILWAEGCDGSIEENW